ncbi:MAG: Bax inhibitor-1/YccA family protein [Chloroflexota bacterium]
MTTLNPQYPNTHGEQTSTNNPALNQEAFDRAVERGGEKGQTGMTAMGAYLKTGLLLLLTIVAAVWGWNQVVTATVFGVQTLVPPDWMFFAYLATFILGIMAIFAGRFTWLIAILYALAYGTVLGVTSHYYDARWDGIVLQAIIGTIAVFGATWVLFTTGIIKPTGKLAMFVSIAMIGLLLVWGFAWFLSLFGINFTFLYEPSILGILFALFIVLLGALNLPLDFNFIKMSAEAGAPKYMEWYGAYGLMLSMIWMYVSILRLLSLLRER